MQPLPIKKFFLRCPGLLLLLLAFAAAAQNVNTPNKIGPMGLQVNTLSGNLFLTRNDLYIPARGLDLNISFTYNSFNYELNTGFGNGWSFLYHIKYRSDTGNAKTIIWGDGREDSYTAKGTNSFKPPVGNFSTLTEYQAGKFLVKEKDGTKFYFDNPSHKRITKMEEPNGNFISFSYADTLLTSLTNTAGQTISFLYVNGRLSSVTDGIVLPARHYFYSYDAAGNLVEATDPLGNKNKYAYLVNGPLKSVTDKNNNVVNIVYYNDFAVSELVGCNKRVSFSYDMASLTSYATDHLSNGNNQVTKYEYEKHGEVAWLVKQSGNCCGFTVSYEYDEAGNVIKQTDANGNAYTATYDERGNVVSTTDPLNQVTSYTYSTDFNKVLTTVDANGNTRTMSYDSKGNLVQLKEPGGLVTTMVYSAEGDLIKITDPKGDGENYTYDAYGNQAMAAGSLGFTILVTHDARGNLLSMTDPRGFVYTNEYDVLNRLIKTINPANGTAQLSYDGEGNIVSVTNANGQSVLLSYDASNRLVAATNALGHKRLIAYDEMNNIVQLRNPLGQTLDMKYDNRNQLSSVKDMLGNMVQYSYDPNGNLVAIAHPSGRVVKNTFDALDRLVKTEDGGGTMGTVSYDKNGNITKLQNATGAVFTFSYDGLNRLTQTTDALGFQKTYQYDNNGNLVSRTDRNGNTMTYVYDALNRPVSYTDQNGYVSVVTYDLAGNVSSVTDPKNNTTGYTYDNLNRLSKTTYADGKFIQYGYDNIGNMLTKKQTDGTTISYQYDALNRLVSKTLPAGDLYTYGYDVLNRLVSASNDHASITLSYDAINRLSAESTNGKTTRYSYDNPSLVRSIVYPDSTVVTKTFDNRYRLTGVARGNTTLATYQYNSANQVIQATFGNQVSTNLQYDFANRLNTWNTGNGSIQNYNLIYDKEMNISAVSRLNNPALSEEYSYDAGNRLTNYQRGASGSPNLQHTYNYDQAGNRTSSVMGGNATSYTTNNLNQVTALGGSQNTSFAYDDNGNLTYDGSFHKKYDAEGRLLTDSASPSNKIIYQYDPFGRRLRKIVNGAPVDYTYSGMNQIEQRDGITDTLINRTILSGFLRPLCLEKNNDRYYYHINHLGSVEGLSNASGNLQEKYEYDPYGNVRIADASNNTLLSSSISNGIGFTGQQQSEGGNLAFQFRNYSPQTGTFNQRDPLGYADGPSLYRYVGNNPASKVDFLGLQPVESAPGMDVIGPDLMNYANNNREQVNQGLADNYQAAKTLKDIFSTLSAIDRNNLLKEMADPITQRFQSAFPWQDWAKKHLAENSRLNQFLNNPWTQRLVIGLKFIALPEKFIKIYKEWHCGKLKTIINTTDAGLSTASLLYSLGKLRGWQLFKSSPTWLVVHGVSEISSKSFTGKSILTNIADLPFNVFKGYEAAWSLTGAENALGPLDNFILDIQDNAFNRGTPVYEMPNWYNL